MEPLSIATLLALLIAAVLFSALVRQTIRADRAEIERDHALDALSRVERTIRECVADTVLTINPTGAAKVLADARARMGARLDAEDVGKALR